MNFQVKIPSKWHNKNGIYRTFLPPEVMTAKLMRDSHANEAINVAFNQFFEEGTQTKIIWICTFNSVAISSIVFGNCWIIVEKNIAVTTCESLLKPEIDHKLNCWCIQIKVCKYHDPPLPPPAPSSSSPTTAATKKDDSIKSTNLTSEIRNSTRQLIRCALCDKQ